ncbi:hypothetical protein B9Z55_003424 [Caenorhabditis nigoni]|uniref:Uncharacterized protein n=1 Tax=Caenorhabditis nigoni TaxID=1611254 RepID=A0A2G5VQD5_9PELO|nr:hypothetical protein B9Z55_003424 [Caenorhabditis nigoni]
MKKSLEKSIFAQGVGKSALTIQLIQNISLAFSDGSQVLQSSDTAGNLKKKICKSSDCLRSWGVCVFCPLSCVPGKVTI